eukprot:gene5081-7088_t
MYQLLFLLSTLIGICYGLDKTVYSLGIDYGTSGVRGCLINSNMNIIHELSIPHTNNEVSDAVGWENSLNKLLEDSLPLQYRKDLVTICVSGTSASALVYNIKQKKISRNTRMYNYNVLDTNNNKSITGQQAMNCIKSYAPADSAVVASTSTLAKLLSWHFENPLLFEEKLVHQSDYLSYCLRGKPNDIPFISDWHNALKVGYDVAYLDYPVWLKELLISCNLSLDVLPQVIEPGKKAGIISSEIANKYSINECCEVIAGTTDSIAAFIASGADKPGQAVSSLGSTLAIKSISEKRVEDSKRGIYSHRLGNEWLVGGASNVGCAIFRKEGFSNEELELLSRDIDPNEDSHYKYYPLLKQGERFPTNNPLQEPVLDPKPMLIKSSNDVNYNDNQVDRKLYLQGLLHSIAVIEKQGYDALEQLGASPITEVFTAGGGAKNNMWSSMRSRILQKKVSKAFNVEASYGCARLALKYFPKN